MIQKKSISLVQSFKHSTLYAKNIVFAIDAMRLHCMINSSIKHDPENDVMDIGQFLSFNEMSTQKVMILHLYLIICSISLTIIHFITLHFE